MGRHGRAGAPRQGRSEVWATRLHRHRRGLAAVASGLAVLCLGAALRPADPAMVEVVVAARDLPTGHRISPQDVAIAPVPGAVLPPGATSDPALFEGAALAAPIVRGEALSTARLVTSLASLTAPPGTVPTPVRFADPAAVGLLSAGETVDVLAARAVGMDDTGAGLFPAPARVLAPDALVLAVLSEGSASGDEAPIMAEAGSAPLVLLALTPDQALAVAGAEPSSRLSFTLGGPPS